MFSLKLISKASLSASLTVLLLTSCNSGGNTGNTPAVVPEPIVVTPPPVMPEPTKEVCRNEKCEAN